LTFKSNKGLTYHKNKTLNCINKCHICLKIFSNKQSLQKHESVLCKQKYQCEKCNNIYTSRFRLKNHVCKQMDLIENKLIKTENKELIDIIKNLPQDKQIFIINQNINSDNSKNINNENNIENNIEVNNNSKNDNSKKQINTFIDTKPKNFNFDYVIREELVKNISKFLRMDDYTEELADQYMYEESKFKKEQNDEVIRKYDKEPLQVEGMKQVFSELQKEPKNRNVVMKKSKSGKCHVYDKNWNEKKLKEITMKICNKVCDTLFEKETSLNHFIRLVLGSQPRRYSELKKHIHDEILKVGKEISNEIENLTIND
jgi:hypothetical protein